MISLIKKTSAWLPIAMSLAALMLLLVYLIIFGINQYHNSDEGIAAHLFQLLMAGQVPIIMFFVIKYLPQMPKQALKVLALQIIAALAAFAPVYFLEL
jgi:hypothetical protein